MKSGAKVRWKTGERPVLPNFARQLNLDAHFMVSATYHLVVADAVSFAFLRKYRPAKPTIDLIYFPDEAAPSAIEEEYEGFVGDIATLVGGTWKEAFDEMGVSPDWYIDDDRNEIISTYRAFRGAFEALKSSEVYSISTVVDIVDGITHGRISLEEHSLSRCASDVLYALEDVTNVLETRSRVTLLFRNRAAVEIPVVLGGPAGDHFDSLLQHHRPKALSDVMRLAFRARNIEWEPLTSTTEFLTMFKK